MTEEEKCKKFDEVQKYLWAMARHGNSFQSAMAAALIRELGIESPEGDDPNEA